jgi:DNA-binding transcriptional ArsR family regulator
MPRASADGSVFNAIADPLRREILQALGAGEKSAGELIAPFAVTQSAASQHLAVLRRANLVTVRRDGRRQLYRLNPAPLYEVTCWVRHFDRFWDVRLDNLGRYLDRRKQKKKEDAP